MAHRIWKKEQVVTSQYFKRCDDREIALMTATMNFVGYFIMLDDSADDDLTKKANAEIKVSEVSTAVAEYLYAFRLGNKQPLIDAINNIDVAVMPFMDADAKSKLISDLNLAI